MAEKTEVAEIAEATEGEAPAAEATKTYKQEDLDAVKAEYESRVVDLENQNKGIRKLQSEAALELNKYKNQPQSSGQTEILEALIKSIPKQTDEYGKTIANPEIVKAQARLNYLKQQERQKQALAQLDGERQKMRKEAEDVGIDPDGEELALVELAWDNNNALAARKWLNKAIQKHSGTKKETAVEKKVETEDELRARIKAEVVKELTQQDTTSPSGTSQSFKDVEVGYSEGKVDYATYAEARKKQNL